MSDNRRKLRTHQLRPAIELLLRSICVKHGLNIAAVADQHGLYIGGHGDELTCRVLAEHAALLDTGQAMRAEILEEYEERVPGVAERMAHRAFKWEAETLHIIMIAPDSIPDAAALEHAQTGISRILDESTA